MERRDGYLVYGYRCKSREKAIELIGAIVTMLDGDSSYGGLRWRYKLPLGSTIMVNFEDDGDGGWIEVKFNLSVGSTQPGPAALQKLFEIEAILVTFGG